MTTAAAWQLDESEVREELEERRRRAEEFAKQRDQVGAFWRVAFPDLIDARIEMPQFRHMNLEERIAEQLADTDTQIVRLIAHPGIFLLGNYSNSVQ